MKRNLTAHEKTVIKLLKDDGEVITGVRCELCMAETLATLPLESVWKIGVLSNHAALLKETSRQNVESDNWLLLLTVIKTDERVGLKKELFFFSLSFFFN